MKLRVAMARAKDMAKDYGRQAEALTRKTEQATQAVGAPGGGGGGGLLGAFRSFPVAAAAVVGALAGVAEGIGKVRELVAETVALGTELDLTSKRLGTSTQGLQQWEFIAGRAGIEAQDLHQAFTDLADKAESGDDALRKLGVRTKDNTGHFRSQEQIFSDTLAALGRMDDATKRAALAQQLLGDQGSRFLPIADMTSEQLGELRKRFRDLGGGLGDDVIQASADAGDAMGDFRLAMLSLRGVVVADLLPAITPVIVQIATAVGKIAELVKTSSIGEVALGTLAAAFAALAIAMLPVSAPILVIAAGLALLVLAVDDVVTAFRGGDSVFGGFVEAMLESVGITTTFQGALERLGIMWEHVKAVAFDAVAGILRALDSLPAALTGGLFAGAGEHADELQRTASAARDAAASQTKSMRFNEIRRRTDRANQTVHMRLDRQQQDASAAPASVRDVKIEVHGAHDPEATGRAVRREFQHMLRGAADGEPLAEPEGA